MKFRDLKAGQHFRFTDDRTGAAYGPTVKKVSANCYVIARKDVVTGRGAGRRSVRAVLAPICFRQVSAGVVLTGRSSPVKKRKGKGRGPAQLGRWR